MRKPKTELTDEIMALQRREDLDIVTMARSYRLITPLFGGGVEAGQVDTVTPVSGKAVRGNLRFWWRAVRGGQFGDDLEKLKAREDQIWGSAEIGSKVKVWIAAQEIGSAFTATDKYGNDKGIGDPRSQFSYVAFPLREYEYAVYQNVSFELCLSLPQSLREDVEAALWAWESFGGVGARTRRGFGALACEKVIIDDHEQPAPLIDKTDLASWFAAQLAHYQKVGIDFHKDVSHIPADLDTKLKIVATPPFDTAEKAWLHLIEHLQQFRHKRPQNKVTEKDKTFIRPGRNSWPEPDVIRKLSGKNPKGRDQLYKEPAIDKFPRAAFGLPIEFDSRDGDIPNATLRAKEGGESGGEINRMSSPLILRPYQCANNQYVALALILESAYDPLNNLVLIEKATKREHSVDATLTPPEAASIAKRAKAIQNNYDGNVDILQSFIDSL